MQTTAASAVATAAVSASMDCAVAVAVQACFLVVSARLRWCDRSCTQRLGSCLTATRLVL